MPALAGKPLRTRETEAIETPARFATVTTVGRRAAFLAALRAAFLRVNVFTARPETLRRRGAVVNGYVSGQRGGGSTETGLEAGRHRDRTAGRPQWAPRLGT